MHPEIGVSCAKGEVTEGSRARRYGADAGKAGFRLIADQSG